MKAHARQRELRAEELAHNPRLSTLPAWAQDHICDLQRQRDTAVTVLREFSKGQTPTKIWYERHPVLESRGGPETILNYLDTRWVNFRVGEGENDYVELGYDNHGRLLLRGMGRLALLPETVNTVVVQLVEAAS